MKSPTENTNQGRAASTGSAPDPVLGDFELRREIGRGGMGTVFEAWQKSLQRVVALKVLAGHVSGSRAAIQRFQREAQAAAKLHHTHIVPIFAQGEERGTYFYAMEYVEGTSLHAILSASRSNESADTATVDLMETVVLPRSKSSGHAAPESTVASRPLSELDSTATLLEASGSRTDPGYYSIIAQHVANVADALDYAHQRGVIHRDVKPHNLMMGRDGRMRIADFGLARLAEQPAVTITGEMLGSPLYMSPEQITEGPSKVDARTDVYSLGVTLYEWLTLKPPFPGETREAVISRIVHSDPPAPSEHNPTIPLDLETICLKAMERDLHRRYQSAGEFRDDLRRFLSQRAIQAKRASMVQRSRKFIARHQLATLATAVIVTLFVSAGLGVALVRKQRVVTTQQAAVRDLQAEAKDAQEDAITAQADAKRILDYLETILPVELRLAQEGAKLAPPVAQGLVKSAQELTGSVGLATNPWGEATRLDTPEAIAHRGLRAFYDSARRENWPEPPAHATDALAVFLRSALTRMDNDPAVAFELVDGVLSSRPEDYETRQLHAVLAGQLGHHVKMATDGEEMVRMQGANANAYLWRALAELFLDRPEESLRDVLRALELNEESHWGRAMLGLVLLELRRPSEAMMTLDRVVAEAPQIEMAWLGRAASHAANSDWTRAIADVTRIVENTPTDTDAWLIRGDYNSLQGDQSAAVADYERAIALGGKTNPVMSRWYAAMAKRIRAGVRAPGPITPPNPTEAASSDADTTLTDPKRGSSGLSISDFLAFGR